MAAQKPSLAKGTRDFGPAEVQKRKYILNTIETVFKKYGFMPLETPAMENLTTLEGKYGAEGDQLLFRILNSGEYLKELIAKDNQALTNGDTKTVTKYITEKGLRYDLTVPFARYVVMNRNNITFPFKRYQMQPVWRADRPQKGRYREFWQCDADVVGSDSLFNELDLIQIYDEAYTKLGIGYELRLNNRKVLAGIAETVKGIEYMNTIAIAIDKLDKIGVEGVSKELEAQGFSQTELSTLFDIISIKGTGTDLVNALRSRLAHSTEGQKGLDELEFLLNILTQPTYQHINLIIDFSLARGLSYYTGCIFEITAINGSLRSSIGGGGRYDNLTGIFGLPNVSGVGISFGVDRIYDVMEELQLFPAQLKSTQTTVLFCHFNAETQAYCLPALKQLRDAGIAAEIYPDNKKLGKQLDYANALHIPFAAIAGEDEMKAGVFNLKNLISGEQRTYASVDLLNEITSYLNH